MTEVKIRKVGELTSEATSFTEQNLRKWEAGAMYRDLSTLTVVPSRESMVHVAVLRAWQNIQRPMNQRHMWLDVSNMEVGAAYEWGVEQALGYGVAFIATMETDNIIPFDGMRKLYEAIYTCIDCGGQIADKTWECEAGHRGLDGVSGLYWAKGEGGFPMAFGTPGDINDFVPRSLAGYIEDGKVMEVNGIANGCSLFRAELFKKVSKPRFKTLDGADGDLRSATQDLYFCRKAKEEAGARFAVHTGVKVGHMDLKTGQVW